jgi:hypothetical protein
VLNCMPSWWEKIMTSTSITVPNDFMADSGTKHVTCLIWMVDTCRELVRMVKELTGTLGVDIITL